MHTNTHTAAERPRTPLKTGLAVAGAAAVLSLAGQGTAFADEIVTEHEVERGETLAQIADAHELDTWRLLYDANTDLDDPDLIFPGQVLEVPAAGADVERRSLPGSQSAASAEAEATPAPQQSAPEPTPPPDPEPEPATATANAGVWDRLAECESNGDWSINTGNGYYGGLQFSLSSWRWVGGSGYPHEASKAEQIQRAERLLERQGWNAWPACSRQLGLR